MHAIHTPFGESRLHINLPQFNQNISEHKMYDIHCILLPVLNKCDEDDDCPLLLVTLVCSQTFTPIGGINVGKHANQFMCDHSHQHLNHF